MPISVAPLESSEHILNQAEQNVVVRLRLGTLCYERMLPRLLHLLEALALWFTYQSPPEHSAQANCTENAALNNKSSQESTGSDYR